MVLFNNSAALGLPPTSPHNGLTSVAKLATSDNQLVFAFLVNPETIVYSYTSEFTTLPVLNTGQPLTTYKYSANTISLPKVYLWTQSQNLSLAKPLETLEKMMLPTASTYEPPVVSFTYGSIKHPRVSVKTWKPIIKQTRGGLPTEVEGSMELIIVPEVPTLLPAEPISTTSAPTSTPGAQQLTQREQDVGAANLDTYLKNNPQQAVKLGINRNNFVVNANGQILVNSIPVATFTSLGIGTTTVTATGLQ